MELVALAFVPLMLFPLIVVVAFQAQLIHQKQQEISEELNKLRAMDTELVKGWGGESGISGAIARYYSRRRLLVPASLLSFFYAAGFLGLTLLLLHIFCKSSLGERCMSFLMAGRPAFMTFLGVYLFNLGTTVRRLYLADLSEHVFWSGINRLLLAVGLAVVIATAYRKGADPNTPIHQYFYFVFFALGFLANVFLAWVMETALKVLNIFKPKVTDLPLQMVEGINVWREFRLEEEGIESVQNLATADVIDLAVKTHFNLRTLLDWIDQAILLDRFGEKGRLLAEKALIKGAIDLAWKAPKNTGETETAELLAGIIDVNPKLMANLMDNLYEDAYVETLWTLWQTKREVGTG